MTLRQDELIKRLPENGFNISKTARQVGYTEQGSRSGVLYQSLRRNTKLQRFYEPEQVKKLLMNTLKTLQDAKDYSNLLRAIELIAKISGLTKEQIQQQAGIFAYIQPKSVDNPVDKVVDNITATKPLSDKDLQQGNVL